MGSGYKFRSADWQECRQDDGKMIRPIYSKKAIFLLALVVTAVTFYFILPKSAVGINNKYPNSHKSIAILHKNDLHATKKSLESNGVVVTLNLQELLK